MTCDERRDLLLLFTANALEAAEMEEMRRHLATGCPGCAGALAEAQATFAAIGFGVESVHPSKSAKARLMARVDRTASSNEVDQFPENLATRIFKIFVPMAVAAGLAIVITHAVVTRDVRNQAFRTKAVEMMLTSREREIQSLTGQLQSQKQIVDLVKTMDFKLVRFDGGKLQSSAVAGLLWDQKASRWIMLASGMTPLPAGKTYELWYITADQKKIAAGTFDLDANGSGKLVTKIPTDIGEVAVAAVTDEPIGGLPQPSGNIQLVAKLR